MPSTAAKLDGQVCKYLGCNKPTRARGFCVACYYRKLRRGELVAGSKSVKFKHRLSNVDVQERLADCVKCGRVKITSRGRGSRLRSKSDEDHPKHWRCYNQTKENSKLYKRAYRVSKRSMMSKACEICGAKGKKRGVGRLHWDHDHKTGLYRGTLCGKCNLGLGLFKDNVKLLKSAIDYLQIDRSTKPKLVLTKRKIKVVE